MTLFGLVYHTMGGCLRVTHALLAFGEPGDPQADAYWVAMLPFAIRPASFKASIARKYG
jgi:hypothetical protein